jgi:DNA-binding transcriptional LysR family regulator
MVAEQLARGDLVEIVPELRPAPMPIAAVMPSGRLIPSRVRALLELIELSREQLPAPPIVSERPRSQRRRT